MQTLEFWYAIGTGLCGGCLAASRGAARQPKRSAACTLQVVLAGVVQALFPGFGYLKSCTLPSTAMKTATTILRSRCRVKGFTLIELLVVIGIIAVLIGLLLPSLFKAKRAGMDVKCLANNKQIAQAAISYAMDFKDRIWPALWRQSYPAGARLNNPSPDGQNMTALWAMIYDPATGLRRPGFLFQYVSDAHEIVSCPINKRRSAGGQSNWNPWGVELGVQFDYTMIDEVEGCLLGATTNVMWMPPGSAAANNYLAYWNDSYVRMQGIPLFLEESTLKFNGDIYRDGLFGNRDQLTTRHERGGHVSYVDGSSALFKAPNDGREDYENPARDWTAKMLYASNTPGANRWYAISDADGRSRPAGRDRYGWINQPY